MGSLAGQATATARASSAAQGERGPLPPATPTGVPVSNEPLSGEQPRAQEPLSALWGCRGEAGSLLASSDSARGSRVLDQVPMGNAWEAAAPPEPLSQGHSPLRARGQKLGLSWREGRLGGPDDRDVWSSLPA